MDCSGILYLLEKHAPRSRFPDADKIRFEATRGGLKIRPVPEFAVMNLYRDYQYFLSVRKVARKYGIQRTHVRRLFKRFGLPVRKINLQPRITHNGVEYAFDGKHCYRETKRGRQTIKLHRVLWEERNGRVPKGHYIVYANGNCHDLRPENIVLKDRAAYFAHLVRIREMRRESRKAA